MTSCEPMKIKRKTEFKKLMNHYLLRLARIARPCCGHSKATNSVAHKRKGLVSKVFDKVCCNTFHNPHQKQFRTLCTQREEKKTLKCSPDEIRVFELFVKVTFFTHTDDGQLRSDLTIWYIVTVKRPQSKTNYIIQHHFHSRMLMISLVCQPNKLGFYKVH